MNLSEETIFALSSGHGRSGVAVVRVSGKSAKSVVAKIAGKLPRPRHASLRVLKDPVSDEMLDKALVLWFPAPASFTGEDSAEFHIHGGPAVISGFIEALQKIEGCRLAEPGEFSRRAFENGKLDLTEVEGLADLIEAETQAQKRQALMQSQGVQGKLYESWRADIIHALASVEAALDFSDEADVPEAIAAEANPYVEKIYKEIRAHLNDGRRGEMLRDGFRVVIAGPPNAGKSSLLNLLAKRDVAIVSDEAGTTRDVIEVRLNLSGYPVILSDTAGIHDAEGAVEREGIRRSRVSASQADLILWMQDASFEFQDAKSKLLEDPPQKKLYLPSDPDDKSSCPETPIWTVLNKIDKCTDGVHCGDSVDNLYRISVKTGEGIDAFVDALEITVQSRLGESEAPAISRARHRRELEACIEALDRYRSGETALPELRAEDLRQAALAIGRITGRVDVEEILDEIFSSFCIGK